ncbi:acetylcholinesterase-1-like [Rhipicephalus sanguineus]|uniref:acetylcholinesterase-1-like n=1 Tax=Rhipicephalus sanguineus TaxID=34632 RepID=UPI001895127D|nr:acetylcholinesterase-1-like [Rhipicephalus sanguineus]
MRGARRIAPEGKSVYAFTGVRYAKPPIGELRYRKPQPEPPWDVSTSEDCVYLNVWTPTLNNTASLPVMAWLHGGRFLVGSAAMHLDDGGNLAALGNVVVVTIGYRLQSFGLLYDGTEEAPGNQGLYDQLLALEWIRSNIGAFGGDPGEVTLFGWSAGGMTIGFFLSIADVKLPFKRAIVQSGPATRKGLTKNNTIALNESREFASIFGCAESSQNDTSSNFVSCLRNVNASLILAVERIYMDSGGIFTPIFGDGLLQDNPETATFRGDRDILMRQVANEGGVNPYIYFPDVFSKILPPRNVSKSEMVYYLGALRGSLSLAEILDLHELYMGNISDFDYDQLRQAFTQEEGDVLIFCASLDTALKIANSTATANSGKSIHFYELDYVSRCRQTQPWTGMAHGDDMPFVFGRPFDQRGGCPEDMFFSRKIIEIWSNFARGRRCLKEGSALAPLTLSAQLTLNDASAPVLWASLDLDWERDFDLDFFLYLERLLLSCANLGKDSDWSLAEYDLLWGGLGRTAGTWPCIRGFQEDLASCIFGKFCG